MKTLYLDCGMGAAGDMLTAALVELLPDSEAFIQEVNALGIPGVQVSKEKSVKCGITGTHISVAVNGQEEESHDHHHDHHHHHTHDDHHDHEEHHHEHNHSHSGLHDIEHIVMGHLPLEDKVKSDIMAVYKLIAEAESVAHGVPVTEIHFHEVGTMDAIADIAAVCMLINKLAPDEILASPIHVGSGQVRCQHGVLPVPAPATAYILKEVPIYGGSVQGELCTPTGAALLKHFANKFGAMPVMKVQAIGYGMGKKDFEAANCVRALLGETEDKTDKVLELSCNLDDMTPEGIGYAMKCLFEDGALDVYTSAIGMKKSRPGTLLSVICSEEKKDCIIASIFKHTTTLGIRESEMTRYTLNRTSSLVETPYGNLRRKDSSGYGVSRSKFEYEDICAVAEARGISFTEAAKLVEGK